MPAAPHFRNGLAILDLSIFEPASRHFSFELVIFAPIAHNFRLTKRFFIAGARHFLRELANLGQVACHSRIEIVFFV